MKNWKTLVAAALPAALLIAPTCFAQGRGGPPRGGPDGGPPPEMAETIQIYAIHKMREYLELDEQQTLRLMELMEERREAERDLRQRRHEAMQALRELVEQDAAGDREYLRAIEDLEELGEEMRRRQEDLRRKEEAILTPRQRARRILFEPRFREHLRERMREIGMHRRQGRGGGMEQRLERLERLKETNPELYEEVRTRLESGEQLTPEERRRLMQEMRRGQRQNRSGEGSGGS